MEVVSKEEIKEYNGEGKEEEARKKGTEEGIGERSNEEERGKRKITKDNKQQGRQRFGERIQGS